ncbi:MAG: chemotaxis protein CheB [Halothiobacillus sp.]
MTIRKIVKKHSSSPTQESVVTQEHQTRPVASEKFFPVVGMGASAGGLEAFEQFFNALPADAGMAFILVPHLDPSHASLLTEILQRSTVIPVHEATDQMAVEPNHVYIVPPNRDMAIFHGRLQLSLPDVPYGQRMPINTFLCSLAEDQGERAVGIILSGTGTDGSQGLRAILGAGGFALVQEPGTAKYDGMPNSAIQAGYGSRVLPPGEMPEALLKLPFSAASPGKRPEPAKITADMNQILMVLRTATGHDFSLYKKNTISRRILRRMAQHELKDLAVYTRYLKEHPTEVHILFKELLINVTSFFRDSEAFDTFEQDILPGLLDGKPEGYIFRVWVVGCASGEEAYSIAMLLREHMEETARDFNVQIYATDLDEDAIAEARAGLYPPNITVDVSPKRLNRFFVREEAGYRIKKIIREMVIFAVHNVIKDPPFTKLDLLTCRNLMIYLEPELQNQLLPKFHYALKPGGVLFLSPSESIGNHSDLFFALNRKWKFYRAIHGSGAARKGMGGSMSWSIDGGPKIMEARVDKVEKTDFAEITRRALLQSYAPASVVTDLKGNIVFVYGETGKYLRPAPGQASLNVTDMAREGLQQELRNALHAVESMPVLQHEVMVKTDGDFQAVRLSVRRLPPSYDEGLLLISFQDLPNPAATQRRKQSVAPRISELERALALTKENLHATIEAQQASNEELKSTNEELQSTNEELQSTNEELETSKEELQSVNEELTMVNAELQSKIGQLVIMQNDMKNLLDNIHVGTVFLDQNLLIRRFTREAELVYRLVAADVGRPLADIKSNIEGEDLLTGAQVVLDSLVPREYEVHTPGGTWYLARIQPYRTLNNVIDGVVMTFTDISQHVASEQAVQKARMFAEAIVDTIREPLLVLDSALCVVSASRAFYQRFATTPAKTIGSPLYELAEHRWNIPQLRALLADVLSKDQTLESYTLESDTVAEGAAAVEPRRLILNARRVVDRDGGAPLLLLAMEELQGETH